MKKGLLLLVSGLLIACMAGSAVAGVSTATVLMPNKINISPDGTSIYYIDVNILVEDGNSGLPQTYTVRLEPSAGLEAYIGDSTDIISGDDTNINVGSLSSWSTSTLYLSDSFKTTALDQHHTGKLYVKGTADGTVKVKVYEGNSVIADDIVSVESLGVSIPEFPTVAFPIAALIGLVFIFGRKKEGL